MDQAEALAQLQAQLHRGKHDPLIDVGTKDRPVYVRSRSVFDVFLSVSKDGSRPSRTCVREATIGGIEVVYTDVPVHEVYMRIKEAEGW